MFFFLFTHIYSLENHTIKNGREDAHKKYFFLWSIHPLSSAPPPKRPLVVNIFFVHFEQIISFSGPTTLKNIY